jgi:hypothetical protein
LHAGADLPEYRRLFVYLDLEAALDEGKRCRQPAYAAPGHNDLRFSGFFQARYLSFV